MVDAPQHQEQVKGRNELIQTFLYSIRSKETQNLYQRQIGYFEEFHKQPVDKLLTLDTKVIEQILISYTVSMGEKKLSYATIHSRLAAMSSFLELNDVSINKKKIRKFMGENIRTVKDEAYTHEDLLKMCEQSSFRAKLIIAIYSSTGIRKAALADLQLCHLTKIEEKGIRLYKFVIYENTKDEYITFCTPECANLIDAYLDQRRKAGEKITDESYLIRNDFDYFGINARNPKKLTVQSLAKLITFVLDRSDFNFRQPNHKTENYVYKRQKKSLFHAFRKYFNTCLANCDVNVTIKEMLMGHSIGLDDTYYKPNEKQLLAEYSKAINELTIEESNRLRTELDVLKEKQDKIDMLVSRIQLLEKQYQGEVKK